MATYIELEGIGRINVKDGTSFPINYNIQNLLDVNQTPASYSKDIIIIGDKETNQILGHLYDINVDGTFNVNKKQLCTVYQNGVQIMTDVYFQLLSISNERGKIEYVGRVKSILMDFFTTIKDKKLDDLSLSSPDTNHILTKQNVKNTFNNTYVDKYKYITYYRESTIWDIRDFRPAIFLKTYWDAIHNQNGWEYEFDEFLDLRLDKLLIPSSNKYEVSDLFKQEHGVLANAPLNTLNTYNNSSVPRIIGNGFAIGNEVYIHQNIHNTNIYNLTWTSFSDPDGLINGSNMIIPTFQGEYYINFKFDYIFQLSFTDPVYLDTDYADSLVGMHYINILVERNNGSLELIKTNVLKHFWKTGKQYSAGIKTIDNSGVNLDLVVDLGAGDKIIQIMFTYEQAPGDINGDLISEVNNQKALWKKQGSPNAGIEYNPRIVLDNIELSITPQITYNYGAPIYLDNFIPRGISQRDFIKSIIDMYRLVIEVDPNKDNKLIYTTRDKFYDIGKQLDWSEKIDVSREKIIQWIQDKQSKSLLLTYKEDKDYYNMQYTDKTKYIYGQYDYRFENDYNIGQTKNELIFSPTPIIHNKFSNMYIPAMIAEEDYNIRLLYDNGIYDNGWFYWVDEYGDNGDLETEYPTALHFDNPNNPSYDINFGVNAYYYYPDFNITYNNITELYHSRFLSQLSKGRIMTAFFHLEERDIINLKLNEKIWVDNAWWNINKIIDYNANGSSLTKVELITIDDGIQMKFRRGINGTTIKNPVTGVAGPFKPTPSDPIIWEPASALIKDIYLKKTISSRPIGGHIIGVNNTINGQIGQFDGIIIGGNNIINANTPIVIGNNIQADNDDELYVNNINVETINGENIFNTILDITNSDLITLRDNGELSLNTTYRIIDSDPEGDFEDYVYMNALTKNQLRSEGYRTMRVIKDEYYNNKLPSGVSGSGNYGMIYKGLKFGGAGFSATFIWGCRVWKYEQVGSLPETEFDYNSNALDNFNLNDEGGAGTGLSFTKIQLTDDDYYETKIFKVNYNLDDNCVIWQEDFRNNHIETTYNNSYIFNKYACKYNDWGNSHIYANIIKSFNNLTSSQFGIIMNNSNNGYISYNSNKGYISKNSNSGNISSNSNNGYISNNSNSGNISNNSNNGRININSNSGNIQYNSNSGVIQWNSNSGYISNNSNNGSIDTNYNSGNIDTNSNSGDIDTNSNRGVIQNNSNRGVIEWNSSISGNIMRIQYNSNNGYISYNRGNIASITDIDKNINNGYIGGSYQLNINRTTTISDPIVNK